MTVSFYSIPTNIGASKLANAIATGVPLNLTEMAVGDGGGVYVEPDPAQTALVNECYRTTINSLTVNADDSQQVIAEMVIPEDIGGFTEREIGIFDGDGDLIIVANCAAIEKAAPDSGSPSSQVIKLPIEISSAAEINLVIDPSAIIVTQEYADDTFLKKENNLSDLTDAEQARTNLELGDAATKNTGTTEGTVAAGDDSRITGALQGSNNLSDLTNVEQARDELGLGSAATHDEGDFLSTSGGEVDGDVVINGALTTNGKDVVIESDVDGGFVGVHLKNESTSPNSSCGFDFSFGGAIMASVISGLLGDGSGATFLDFALSPAGDISDRREVAFTANAALRQLIFENGWSLSGYAQLTQFIINDGDAGYLEFPGGALIQWTTGTTDVNGWGVVNFPLAWAQRCAIAIPVNVAGATPATAVAGVKRLDDRTMQATLCGVGGGAVSSPFVIVGFGI